MVALANPPIVRSFPSVTVLPTPPQKFTAIITGYYEETDQSDTLVIHFTAPDGTSAREHAENQAAIIREHGYLYPGSEDRTPNVPDWVRLVMVAHAPLVYLFDDCIINPYLCL